MTDDRTDYDRHMDELAIKIAKSAEGEPTLDVVSACSAIAAFGIRKFYHDRKQRHEALVKIIELMRGIVDKRLDFESTIFNGGDEP
jgi:hypothetical protein